MSEATAKRTQRYTWGDYQSWDDGRRWEIVGGEAFLLAAPSTRHQRILIQLSVRFEEYFKGKRCLVFPAPTDVKLSDEDIVQPDLCVVCDPRQITLSHIEGAPTLVVEILSPSTTVLDRGRKLRLYAQSGIKEVWLITPYPWFAEVLVLESGSYRFDRAYEKEEILESRTFPDLKIHLAEIFNYPIDPSEQIEMVKEGHPPYASGKS